MLNAQDQKIVNQAIQILEKQCQISGEAVTGSASAKQLCQLKFGAKQSEIFALLLLNTRNQLIEVAELFQGTIDGAAVYPREVIKTVLVANAANVILCHNHPSGDCSPSTQDQEITNLLKNSLSIIDVALIDHLIVTTTNTYSFAEEGRL